MSDLPDLPDSWVVWADGDDGRLVLAYRPDVFDAGEYPAPCLPTLYVTHGRRTRRPGRNPRNTTASSDWFVTFYLEPEVTLANDCHSSQAEALAAAGDLARRFDDGELDYRGCYQVPREAYLDRLDDLTGRAE
ncbi:DUF5820 family protein [Natrarchaeobaculum aegyptiacum]|uniref:Uncharacterized protein n=1 Tax=Natrarchaeobaculum aegyptiacum TaxID=745377 RepID=A0A2Z2I1L4_9EURY|nr:DUF5820 family protein [Natrarchaeobaculum aegyptiacum]ARS90398.1 hypothetical protein B1756_12115 [Natrarchaeobaculum aegyptiacum]